MKGHVLDLAAMWVVGDRIGTGGFGQVFTVRSGADQAVAKFVPKTPGADRELLFVSLGGVRNVVPVDSGEHEKHWVLVMPRADRSLRDHLDATESVTIEESVAVLDDITTALADLDGKVVHRDLKPENVLRLNGGWCLADFGISRYAEASTAPDTRKFALSPYYAAPERWRNEHATTSADMYALGVDRL
jgi:serine/threonine-protein kinase